MHNTHTYRNTYRNALAQKKKKKKKKYAFYMGTPEELIPARQNENGATNPFPELLEKLRNLELGKPVLGASNQIIEPSTQLQQTYDRAQLTKMAGMQQMNYLGEILPIDATRFMVISTTGRMGIIEQRNGSNDPEYLSAFEPNNEPFIIPKAKDPQQIFNQSGQYSLLSERATITHTSDDPGSEGMFEDVLSKAIAFATERKNQRLAVRATNATMAADKLEAFLA